MFDGPPKVESIGKRDDLAFPGVSGVLIDPSGKTANIVNRSTDLSVPVPVHVRFDARQILRESV